MTGFTNSIPIAISWGEMVPLSFLKNQLKNDTKYIIFSQPLRRYNHSVEMIPEELNLGGELYDFFDKMPEKIIFLISADLAHTH